MLLKPLDDIISFIYNENQFKLAKNVTCFLNDFNWSIKNFFQIIRFQEFFCLCLVPLKFVFLFSWCAIIEKSSVYKRKRKKSTNDNTFLFFVAIPCTINHVMVIDWKICQSWQVYEFLCNFFSVKPLVYIPFFHCYS